MNIKLNTHFDFYASHLNDEFKEFYHEIITHLAKGDNRISHRVRNGDDLNHQLELLYLAVDLDNQEIFCYSKQVNHQLDGNRLTLEYKFEYDARDVGDYNDQLVAEVDRICAIIEKIDDDFDKLYRLNRYLTIRCRAYMSTAHVASNAFGALITKKSRCEGICKAAKMILDKLGFENLIACGNSQVDGVKEAHSWNMVKVKGNWYHFDFMWNLGYAREGKHPIPVYTFINDAIIHIDHIPFYQSFFPTANDCSHLYWVTHKCQIRNNFELDGVEIVPFKTCYFAIAQFPEPLSEYEADYELTKWGINSFNPQKMCTHFHSTYIRTLQLGIFYFEN